MFTTIDKDKSGSIEPVEFRQLLRLLKLAYSDKRFTLLFRAIDLNGQGALGVDEVNCAIFPDKYWIDANLKVVDISERS